ncbi:MAG: glycosyl transferase family 2, partial [Muribaculaceae bacterium]|nr:glycosyl transferase family 2 [Muribaculaceae bacterium]
LAAYILALWISAIIETKSLKVGTMAVAAAMVQLWGYGTGFLRAYIWKILLRHGRDEEQEIKMRKGK